MLDLAQARSFALDTIHSTRPPTTDDRPPANVNRWSVVGGQY
jgi:hypothetical protein